MDTIQSGGGPLLCIDLELRAAWRGTEGSSSPPMNGVLRLNDYERACASDDYIAKIAVSDGFALVLGDMPLETAVWQTPLGFSAIVRVYYKDPGTNILKILGSGESFLQAEIVEEMGANFQCGDFVIFDSAIPGSDLRETFIPFKISAGGYRIITKKFEPDDRTSVLVHQFVSE